MHTNQFQHQPERFLRVSQLTSSIGVSRTTLWRWQKAGEFPPFRTIGHNIVGILESEYMEWLKSRPTRN